MGEAKKVCVVTGVGAGTGAALKVICRAGCSLVALSSNVASRPGSTS